MLPMIAGLAIILAIFGAVAAPAWFDRDKAGFTDPALSADVLGLLCVLLVALQTGAGGGRDDRLPPAAGTSRPSGRAAKIDTRARTRLRLTMRRLAQVEERQTRSSQKALPLRACGFESRPGHSAG